MVEMGQRSSLCSVLGNKTNPCGNAFENKTLVELPDTAPTILTASLDFATSILSIFVDEPVRLDRLADLFSAKLFWE